MIKIIINGLLKGWKFLKPILENVLIVMGVFGFTLFTFTSEAWGKLHWVEANKFEEKVFNIRLAQNYDFIVSNLGIPQIAETLNYKTIDGNTEEGIRIIYYHKDYMLIGFFDAEKKLFGYTVVSNSKYFDPYIPYTQVDKSSNKLQKITQNTFGSIKVTNSHIKYTQPELSIICFFARSGDEYIEQYYTEIYNLKGMGLLGVATTDYFNSKSKNIMQYFNYLSEISYPSEIRYPEGVNNFYRDYKNSFEGLVLYEADQQVSKEVKEKIYLEGQIGKMKPNSFFLFSELSNVDIDQFLKDTLVKGYFADKLFILQQS